MPDYAFILCFASMLFLPCVVAFHNAPNGEDSVPEAAETGSASYFQAARGPELSRAELAAQRNRELYLRSAGKMGA